jgi:hypothetical protein
MYKMVLETMSSIKQTEPGKRKRDRKKKSIKIRGHLDPCEYQLGKCLRKCLQHSTTKKQELNPMPQQYQSQYSKDDMIQSKFLLSFERMGGT